VDIIEGIKNHRAEFSKAELKVSDYVLQFPEHIETFTITKVAMEAKTSTSAVLRFCQNLGFQGYKDFRFEMVSYLHSQRHNVGSGNVIDTFLEGYSKVINQFQNLNTTEVNNLVDALSDDGVKYLLGLYYSALPAKELSYGLGDLGKVSICANDYMSSAHATRSMRSDSTLVLFSLAGNQANFTDFLAETMNNMPENSFLVTLNPKSELAKIFKHTIVLPGATFSSKSVIDTQTIPMLFVEMVMNLIHEKI